ncbi:MAG: DMT family transporter, partial [Pseudomonadota bacterium]|nr:DMT family transporter [Pseudomonadota bacterium]
MALLSAPLLKRLLPWIILLFLGTVWGLSFSLARIATLAGGTPFGITFWQCIVCGVMLLAFTHARGRPLPVSKRHLKIYVIVALLGASLPNSLFYFAAPHVQAGVLSITVALIPIITYGIAMLIGAERLSALRVSGVVFGGAAIALLVLPESSLPSRAAIPWVLLACLSAVCYAAENIYLSRPALADIGPVRTATGMNILAAVILLPVTLASGQMFLPAVPFGTLEWTILALAVITAVAYTL